MAGIKMTIKSDLDRFARQLDELGRKQLPFATTLAINAMARAAKADVEKVIAEHIDRPTPFTLRAVGYTPALKASRGKKANAMAVVFVKDIQSGYLALEETGGARQPKKQAVVVPVNIKLNQYGNINKNLLQRLKERKNIFIANINGVGGYWQRMPNGHVKLLVMFKPEAKITPRLGYRAAVAKRFAIGINPYLAAAMAKAIATARKA